MALPRRLLLVIPLVLAVAALVWWLTRPQATLPPGFASGNGRAEATEIDIATKLPGRVAQVLVEEGDSVEAGQVIARMDTRELEARLTQAKAELRRARQERQYAQAMVDQHQSELHFAEQQLARSERLVSSGGIARERVDADRNNQQVAAAALQAARIKLIESEAAIEAAEAGVHRIQADLDDSVLTSPRSGRVLYRLAQPGEVLGGGGRVATVLDLDDAYMTLFLPERQAGRLAIGSEARIVLDAFPDTPIPARISYVADQAQFTPKSVETADERQKLMFRVKAQVVVPEDRKPLAKPGLPGVTYVRLEPEAQWPSWLQIPAPSLN